MSASSIFFLGRTIRTPGSYSITDASGLEQVGLGSAGIVAILGTGEGGKPVSAMNEAKDLLTINRPEASRNLFRSGDLREGCAMAFEPANDPDILGGAALIYPMKVNPATQSNASLPTGSLNSMSLTSEDYGAFTSQINVTIGNATNTSANGGKLITVVFEDTTESADDVGGVELFTLQYLESGEGWDTMTAQVLASGIKATGTRAEVGLDGHVLADITDGLTARIISSAAGDTTQTVTIYGLDTSDNPVREVLALNGTNAVPGSQTWNRILGAELSAAAAGTVLVEENTGAFTDILSFTPGQTLRGMVRGVAMPVAEARLSLAADAATTKVVLLWGRNAAGAVTAEKVTLTGATPLGTVVANWSQIDKIVLGDLEAARTVTISGPAAQTSNAVQSTLQKASDYFNARQVDVGGTDYGFFFSMVTGATASPVSDLDLTLASVNIDSPATGEFFANQKAVLDFFNVSSSLLNAAKVAFVGKYQDINITVQNSTTYTFTVDGVSVSYTSDGSATAAEIQAGLAEAVSVHPSINTLVAAAAQGASALRITALTPAGFILAESDANLALGAAVVGVGSGRAPDNTSAPVFLAGGSEGTTTFADWQKALNLLKKVRVNTIIPLTGDPAVHAAVSAHCQFMGGIGRSERDALVGLSALDGNMVPTGALPNKASIKEQIVSLNTRHIRACAQSIDRFNTAGELTTFMPWFQAVVGGGMQAGSTVGTSLTFKGANVLSVNQDSSWNPVDDSEEMLAAGLFFMENVDGVGRRVVRNITTHLSTNNIAFTEASVNEAANFATFTFRTNLETAVGKRGFAGTLNSVKGVAINSLGLLVDEGIITAHRALSLELIVDVLEVSVEIAPVIPINFVLSTVHLITLRQAA